MTSIEWTNETWNPMRGCQKVSAGCKNCYAETFANRFRGVKGNAYEMGFIPREVPEMLLKPLKFKKPSLVFVNSMSDLFHESFSDEYIYKVFTVMREVNWHIYQILTKRPIRMKQLFDSKLKEFSSQDNIWMGVTVENCKAYRERVSILRNTNVKTRFLSIEPLLEDLGAIDLSRLDWVIVGGESGAKCRPMEKSWVQSILKQCEEQNVPMHFKQWGGVRKKRAGRILDGKTYDNFPKFEFKPIPPKSELKQIKVQLEKLFFGDAITKLKLGSSLRMENPTGSLAIGNAINSNQEHVAVS
ncbi:phage Gp37/Gp68 family protein [Leptospira bouyouniensis]|uniref:Phage Gp37/Gp68 family protein n=1 Tax=Leptospira bouyouniensis TaxID=2484911 RepID=A0A7I0HPK6_9LEPT|nr:phage Gp37/Gp68 family protein [Leptospira bouyouniensis]